MASNADDEEEDYMSDAFLAKCADTRPGLARPKLGKRKPTSSLRPTKPPQKSLRVQARETLEAGLQRSLGEENKGFRMMQKMGFQPGSNLGKTTGTGRSEPVPIKLRAGRTGLGHETHQRHKHQQAEIRRAFRACERQKLEAGFRQRLSGRSQEQQMERDVFKSQRACEQLDAQKGLTEPLEKFFWPSYLQTSKEEKLSEDDDDEEEEVEEIEQPEEVEKVEEEEVEVTEQLRLLTNYLRGDHFYCIWCGTAYNDSDDLKSNCPGDTAADHED